MVYKAKIFEPLPFQKLLTPTTGLPPYQLCCRDSQIHAYVLELEARLTKVLSSSSSQTLTLVHQLGFWRPARLGKHHQGSQLEGSS